MDMVTAMPGAISPEFYLGYVTAAMTNYFFFSGVILILWMCLEELMSLISVS
jgi:hypothetical protein